MITSYEILNHAIVPPKYKERGVDRWRDEELYWDAHMREFRYDSGCYWPINYHEELNIRYDQIVLEALTGRKAAEREIRFCKAIEFKSIRHIVAGLACVEIIFGSPLPYVHIEGTNFLLPKRNKQLLRTFTRNCEEVAKGGCSGPSVEDLFEMKSLSCLLKKYAP